MRVLAGLVFASLVMLVSIAAPAEGPAKPPAGKEKESARTLLRRGIELHREAAFAASIAALEQARTQAPAELEAAERAELSFYLAAGYAALGSVAAARRELEAVLAADPSYELPQYTSPKVVSLFRDVREQTEKRLRLRAL